MLAGPAHPPCHHTLSPALPLQGVGVGPSHFPGVTSNQTEDDLELTSAVFTVGDRPGATPGRVATPCVSGPSPSRQEP